MILRIFLCAASALAFVACDSLGITLEEDSPQFGGFSRLAETEDFLLIQWQRIDDVFAGSVNYSLELMQIEDVDHFGTSEDAPLALKSISARAGLVIGDLGQVVKLESDVFEVERGASEHKVPLRGLPEGRDYVLQVFAKTPSGETLRGVRSVYINRVSETQSESFACSNVAQSESSLDVTVEFAWPSRAEAFEVTRDGESIFSTNDSLVASFVDTQTVVGEVYRYECIPVIAGVRQPTQALTTAISDPLEPYNGCLTVTPLGPQVVEVAAPATSPGEVDQFNIFRNGKLIGTVSASSTSGEPPRYLDDTVLPGRNYRYECRPQLSDYISPAQDKTTSVATPTFASLLTGCDGAAEVGATWARFAITASPLVEQVILYRGGNPILTQNKASGSGEIEFTDTGLLPEQRYAYTCAVVLGGVSSVTSSSPAIVNTTPLLEGFQGCSAATPVSTQSIRLSVPFPSGVEAVRLYRDRNLIRELLADDFLSLNEGIGTYMDTGLSAGASYTYQCEIVVGSNSRMGTERIRATTLSPTEVIGSYEGCLSATSQALSGSSIRVSFEFHEQASEASVYRDGVRVFSTRNSSINSFADSGLQEGVSYTYQCAITVEGNSVFSENTLELRTLSTNPPIFSGIAAMSQPSDRQLKIDWGVAANGSVPVADYQVFLNPGADVDWDAEPFAAVEAPALTYTAVGLGDEMPYAAGVRACAANGQCDSNTIVLRRTLSDAGFPLTSGFSAVSIENGEVSLLAPWVPANGALAYRRVYSRSVAEGTPLSSELSDYTLARTFVVGDVIAPATQLNLQGVQENASYHYLLVDVDPSGNQTEPLNPIAVETGDLTPPEFVSGITGLSPGPSGQEETALTLHFDAISPENLDGDGASEYLVYGQVHDAQENPCTDAPLLARFSALDRVSGEEQDYVLTGLQSRTTYDICLKAADAAGNVSDTDVFRTLSTDDVTPPVFDGLQALSYAAASRSLSLSWNPSRSADVLEYIVQVWANTADPAPADIQRLVVAHADDPQGGSYAIDLFGLSSEDQIYVVVQACDDAAQPPLSKNQNCTSSAEDSALVLQLPDTLAPTNFLGIGVADASWNLEEGRVRVHWNAPVGNDWSDYRGFKVYDKQDDSSLLLLKTCPCVSAGCPDQMTSCTVTGLNAYRTYHFHVRPYDAFGNITQVDLDNSTSLRTLDTTAPEFDGQSQLQVSFNVAAGRVDLDWEAATDNQYADEPAELTYVLYRKIGSPFQDPTRPEIDGAEIDSGTILTATDPNPDELATHHYIICARDETGLRTCDQTGVGVLTTPDLRGPMVSQIVSMKGEFERQWDLAFNASDNHSGPDGIFVSVRRTLTLDSPEPPPASAPLILAATAIGSYAADENSDHAYAITGLTGPSGQQGFLNYRFTFTDEAGNVTVRFFSVTWRDQMKISLVNRDKGINAGGRLIQIVGSGFAAGATVDFDGLECTDVRVHYEAHTFLPHVYHASHGTHGSLLTCITPDFTGVASYGSVDVTVTNPAPDGRSVTLDSGYTYCDPVAEADEPGYCSHVCDDAVQSQASLAGGDRENSENPGQICNLAQFTAQMSDRTTNIRNPRYFKLLDNFYVDDNGLSFPSFNSVAMGGFDGGGHIILLNPSPSGGLSLSNSVLFRAHAEAPGRDIVIQNLGVLDFALYRDTANHDCGVISSASSNTATDNFASVTYQDIFMKGEVHCSSRVGFFDGLGIMDDITFRRIHLTGAISGDAPGTLAGEIRANAVTVEDLIIDHGTIDRFDNGARPAGLISAITADQVSVKGVRVLRELDFLDCGFLSTALTFGVHSANAAANEISFEDVQLEANINCENGAKISAGELDVTSDSMFSARSLVLDVDFASSGLIQGGFDFGTCTDCEYDQLSLAGRLIGSQRVGGVQATVNGTSVQRSEVLATISGTSSGGFFGFANGRFDLGQSVFSGRVITQGSGGGGGVWGDSAVVNSAVPTLIQNVLTKGAVERESGSQFIGAVNGYSRVNAEISQVLSDTRLISSGTRQASYHEYGTNVLPVDVL